MAVTLCPSAHAEPSEIADPKEAEARTLFLDGLAKAKNGEVEEACFLFTQSLSLVPRVTTQFNLADCLERRGKLVEARALFLKVAEAMRASGDSAREAEASNRAELLKPRLCKLRILADKPVKSLIVRRDGEVIEPSAWDRGSYVTSGTYSLQASAPGKLPWSVEVEVPVCPSIISVKIPPLTDELPQAATNAALIGVDERPKRPSSTPATTRSRTTSTAGATPAAVPKDSGVIQTQESSPPYLGYAIAGYGVLSSAVGFAFLADYSSSNADAKAVCPSSQGCTVAEITRHTELVREARSARTKGLIGVGLGGVALAVGGFLILSDVYAPKHQKSGVRVGPLLGDNGRSLTGAIVEGSF
ncbi:MAG: tetratricopeptide repeat protein [Polyangiaceae bacterium]|nr:tetratricopeptide repeat protein [Polyangiaceae bacterium]